MYTARRRLHRLGRLAGRRAGWLCPLPRAHTTGANNTTRVAVLERFQRLQKEQGGMETTTWYIMDIKAPTQMGTTKHTG